MNPLQWRITGELDINSGTHERVRLHAAPGGSVVEVVQVDSRECCGVATQSHFVEMCGAISRLPVFEPPDEEALFIPLHPRLRDAGVGAVGIAVKGADA